MRVGTIVLARFPFTDLTGAKRRPALILATPDSDFPDVILVFISSVIPTHVRDADVLIETKDLFFAETGLKKSSIIKVDKIATLDKGLITGEMGSIPESVISLVKQKLKVVLDLE
jgi:mRNA interferase MazF